MLLQKMLIQKVNESYAHQNLCVLFARLITKMVFTMIILDVFNKLINKNREFLNITSKNCDKNGKHYLLLWKKMFLPLMN